MAPLAAPPALAIASVPPATAPAPTRDAPPVALKF